MKFRKKPVVIEAEQFGGIAEEHFPKDGYLVDAEGNRMMFMYWPIQVDEQGDAFLNNSHFGGRTSGKHSGLDHSGHQGRVLPVQAGHL